MVNKIKLLVIDDEAPIRKFLRASFPDNLYEVFEATSGKEGVQFTATFNPDLILLDLGLPDIDGIEVTKQIREWSKVPIIVLSARGQEQDKIKALDHGADDYVTKPFSVGELMARIRAALRNASRSKNENTPASFDSGEINIDFVKRYVNVRGEEVHLTPMEYSLLTLLVRHAGKVLTHHQLLSEVWGPAYSHQNHYLRVFMGQLRHKIEKDPAQPKYLKTEPGVGYRFCENA